ncbi:MAG: phytanoyl-CoA dioxygenase family protein [Novosphingobium sp.]|nr:phytanoyl-CoA dioxygenase family protein [Novosphingobium sp.]
MNPATHDCREVTAEEVAHYREYGWSKLPAFLSPETVGFLLDMAKAGMGEDGDSNPPLAITQPFFNFALTGGPKNPEMLPLLRSAGRNAKALMGRRPDIGAKYYTDSFIVKLPSGKPSKHGGNGRTSYHQDFTNWAVDRSGGLAFWVALTDIRPEAGTMTFIDRSHRFGAMGNYRAVDIVEEYPELLEECSLTGPLTYKAGDATVHSNMLAHGAGENLTDDPRWAYSILFNPSDVRWDGSPAEGFDTTGMRWLDPIDDERFPVLS